MSFRYRLALFLVATLVAVQAVVAAFAYLYLRSSVIEREKRQLVADMSVFARQLDFLSERAAGDVRVLALDYALRSAIAQHDRDTELSALRNHGGRIGATRMMLIGLEGGVAADTARPDAEGAPFQFPAMLQDAVSQDKGAALAALDGKVYWIVVVPVRAPVPIAFIAAFIPVDGAFLDRLRGLSAEAPAILLAVRDRTGAWRTGAQSQVHLRHAPLPKRKLRPNDSTEISDGGHDYLTVMAPLQTAPTSRPVVAVLSYPLDEAFAAYRALAAPLLVVLGLALVAALGGAMLIVRSFSRPLELLAAAARRIAAGDYAAPPRIPQRDEIGHLSEALVNMTDSIAEREAALKSAVEVAEFARGEAEKANEAKSQFLANMSHELRTPLNAIVGFSDMIGQEVLGPVGQRRYLDYAADIHASGEHLLGLVERMLNLAEAESRQLILARSAIDPGPILIESVVALRTFAQKSGVALTLGHGAQTWAGLYGDASKLRQAFVNLIHNAIKFTPGGGEVHVSSSSAGNRLCVRIADSGVGMEPEMLASVVRPFHRMRSALDGQHQGAGVGLPFAKVIIELHGGTLSLASEPGAGTTVTVELPMGDGKMSEAA